MPAQRNRVYQSTVVPATDNTRVDKESFHIISRLKADFALLSDDGPASRGIAFGESFRPFLLIGERGEL